VHTSEFCLDTDPMLAEAVSEAQAQAYAGTTSVGNRNGPYFPWSNRTVSQYTYMKQTDL
jgi:hypothetical protein